VSDEPKQELASVLRITEPGIPGANPKVFAEFQGAIFYTITENFTPGRMDYPYPNVDMYEYTSPRLIGLDIDVQMVMPEQVTGTAESFCGGTSSFVGAELWKPIHTSSHEGDENKWWQIRYHHCTVDAVERGDLSVYVTTVPGTTMMYTGQVLSESGYTPKMRGTNDE
jgi:hypothetical protein